MASAASCLSSFLHSSPASPPPSSDLLLHHISVACLHLLTPFHRSPPPQFSALGLASLLLGISSSLMLFGSFAFFLGFLLVPFIFPIFAFACIAALHGALKSPLALSFPAATAFFGTKSAT